MACNCPVPTALTPITATTCPVDIGQIQRAWFVRKGEVIWDLAAGATNIPAANIPNLPTVLAGWLFLKTTGDDAQVVYGPLFGGDITVTPESAVTQGGGDNSTLNGAVYHVNFPDSTFSARFDQLSALQTADMKLLVCEDLEVYFVNDDGDIIGNEENTGFITGFDCSNVALASRSVQGFATRDSNTVTFQLDPDWDTTFTKLTPTNFNALTGI
jgi:hypothetical protein